jgi:4-hydroxy-tetrahydrodipicolinate reductase
MKNQKTISVEAKSKVESKATVESKTKAEPKTKTESKTKAELKTKTESKTKAEPKIKLAVIGLGKAGLEVARYLLEQPDIRVTDAFCSPGGAKAGLDLGEVLNMRDTGLVIMGSDQLRDRMLCCRPDAVIDFSTPEGTLKHAEILSPMHIRMVVGTTGFTEFSLKRLKVLNRKYENGLVFAPNITTGVNVLMLLSHLAAGLLSQYDFRITETHHSRKKDAPSGTAKKIAVEIEKGLRQAGISDMTERVPIHAIRAGGVVGIHEVMIVGEQDQIRISHESFNRRVFAEGALRAALFIIHKTGWFEMKDTLEMDSVLEAYLTGGKKARASAEAYRRFIDARASSEANHRFTEARASSEANDRYTEARASSEANQRFAEERRSESTFLSLTGMR